METRNTFNAHREAFVVDDLHAEEIIEALTIPDGASDRGFDYIEFEPLYFFDAVAQLTASREASACFMFDLFNQFKKTRMQHCFATSNSYFKIVINSI